MAQSFRGGLAGREEWEVALLVVASEGSEVALLVAEALPEVGNLKLLCALECDFLSGQGIGEGCAHKEESCRNNRITKEISRGIFLC